MVEIPIVSNPTASVALTECRHGRMLYLPHDRYVGRSLHLYGEFSELECRLFEQLVGPGQTVVEIGANIGAHTVHLAKLVGPAGNVLAFEPQRAMFYLLCGNIALNEQFQVRAYRIAIGNAAGGTTVPLLDHRSDANFGGVGLSDASAARETVPLATVDGFELGSLRLLKIDVEGMEIEVVQGAGQTIARHRPLLYVENDRRHNSARLLAMLLELDYELYWHLPPLFNPDNFAGRQDNVFGGVISINVLGIPKAMALPVRGLRRISSPQDWWQEPG